MPSNGSLNSLNVGVSRSPWLCAKPREARSLAKQSLAKPPFPPILALGKHPSVGTPAVQRLFTFERTHFRDLSFASPTLQRLMYCAFVKAKHAVAKDCAHFSLAKACKISSVSFRFCTECSAARESQNASRESVAKGTCERRAQ